MRVYVMPLLMAACGAWLSAAASMMAPVQPRQTVAQIDFDVLHSQASAALEALRQSQNRHMASVDRL
jgi:hypothetical protein